RGRNRLRNDRRANGLRGETEEEQFIDGQPAGLRLCLHLGKRHGDDRNNGGDGGVEQPSQEAGAQGWSADLDKKRTFVVIGLTGHTALILRLDRLDDDLVTAG